MKKVMKVVLPVVLTLLIIVSTVWYLTVYDRDFTRDMLLAEARKNDLRGNQGLSAWFYTRAYNHTGKDPNVAIELANQYKESGNFTKAEVTLSNAIRSSATPELYIALCKTYIQQDKLLDAVTLLANLGDTPISRQLQEMRPQAPQPDHDAGYYTQYISVGLENDSGTTYYTTDGDYPSVAKPAYEEPIKLELGETKIAAITVADNGLVSPMTILNYTVGGVIEPAIFMDSAMEAAVRQELSIEGDKPIFTNDLWSITEFTLPENVSTLDDVSMLVYAEDLTIEGRSFENLDFLKPLSNLKTLTLRSCTFPNSAMQTLAQLPKLQELTMDNCNLSSISELAGAPNLTYLNIANNTVRNLEVLSTMQNLTELDLQHNAIIALDALSGLSNLDSLNVSYNALTGITPLSSCGFLTKLDVSHNQIESLNGLAPLTLMEELAVDYNKLSSLEDLKSAGRLAKLTLSNNTVSSLEPLAGLNKLDVLDFSYNSVSSLPEWSEKCELRNITGSYNSVSSIESLKNLSNLNYLFMDYNKLTSVDALEDSFHLVQVNIYGNAVSDVSKLTEHNIIVNYDPTQK